MKEYQKISLRNGLRVIFVPKKGVESVTAVVMVGTGSRYETKEVKGIAHFLEHMFFKGTKSRPTTAQISSIIDGVGGEFNAATGKEETAFYIKAPAVHLSLILDVLSDILLNSLFKETEIAREKNVIFEEMAMYEDLPTRKVSWLYDELLYGDHPLGWRTIGSRETLAKLSRWHFLDYTAKSYSGANIVVAIAGKLNLQQAAKLVEHFFAKIPKRQPPTFQTAKFSQVKPGVLVSAKKTDQAHLAIGVRTYPLTHPDRYNLAVLSTTLGGGMSSRLFINVRERRGLAYYIASYLEPYIDCGSMVISAGIVLRKIDQAVKVILDEFSKIAQKKVTEAELKKAKDYLKGKMSLELEDTKEVAFLYGAEELLEKQILTPGQIMDKIEGVTAEDVLRVAKDIFKSEKLNLALIGPFKEGQKFAKILKI